MRKICFILWMIYCFFVLGDAMPDTSINISEHDNKPRITELLNVSGVHFDGFNEEHYCYQIPQFYADSESAGAINKRIEDDLRQIIEPELVNISEGYSLITHSVTYEIFECGDITALVVAVPYPNDCMEYFAYTYDFFKDKELTNEELLEMNNMTEEEFVAAVCCLQKEDFLKITQSLSNCMSEQETDEYIACVNEYATMKLPMYLDGSGDLQVYIPFVSLAGAEWYYRLVDWNAEVDLTDLRITE